MATPRIAGPAPSRPRHLSLCAALLLYVSVLVLVPLLHHDLACHVQSPTHCQACGTGLSAPGADLALALRAAALPEAGRITTVHAAPADRAPVRGLSGRSPPA